MRAATPVLVALSLVVAGCASTPGPDPSIPDDPNGSTPPAATDDGTAASGSADLSELFNLSTVAVVTAEKSYERFPHHPEHRPLARQVMHAALNITGEHEGRSIPLEAIVGNASVVLLRTNQTYRDQLEAHADAVPGHLLWVGVVLEVQDGPLSAPSVLLCGAVDDAATCRVFDTEHEARSTLDLANRLGPEFLRYEADPLALKDRVLDQGYLHVRVPYLETVNVTGKLEEQTTQVCTATNTSHQNRSRPTSCQPSSSWSTSPGAVAGEPEGSAYLFLAEAYLSGSIRLPGYAFEISSEPIDDRNVTVTVVGENTSWAADPQAASPEPTPDKHDTPPVEGTYTFIWVHGYETVEPEPERYTACTRAFDHKVHPGEKRVLYDADAYRLSPAGVTHLIAFDVFDRPSGCAEAQRLDIRRDNVTADIGEYGRLDLRYAANDSVLVEGHGWLSSGENLTVTYSERATYQDDDRTRWVNGTITVEHLGTWPRDGLEAWSG